MEFSKKRSLALVLVGIITIFMTLCCVISATASAETPQAAAASSIEIAHITDVHYFPLNDCYLGTPETDENYYNTQFYKSIAGDTKLISQAGTLLSATINNILAEKPDYLVVSGDITRDGELHAHYDVANALRYLQNTLRNNGKPNFQVLVVPGNHDLYNSNASIYSADGVKNMLAENRTSSDAFSVIYNGLGYPDKTITELQSNADGAKMLAYFAASSINDNYLISKYIPSSNSASLTFDYYAPEIGYPTADNAALGCLTYVATDAANGYTFAMIDSTIREKSETSGLEWEHLTGGRITTAASSWLTQQTADERAAKNTIIGVLHHNIAPHYTLEENFTKDFTLYNWEDTATVLADEVGMRYSFTGHMHATDRAQFVSYNGNVLTDLETGSIVSLYSPTRFTVIERAITDGVLTEDLKTVTIGIDTLDKTKSTYINDPENAKSVVKFGSINGENPLTEVIGTQIYDQLVERLLASFVNKDLQTNLINMLDGLDLSGLLGKNNFLKGFIPAADGIMLYAKRLITEVFENLNYNIDGIEATDLIDYAHKLVKSDKIINLVVYTETDPTTSAEIKVTLKEVGVWAYKRHIGGDEPQDFGSEQLMERAAATAIAGFEGGELMQSFLQNLLDALLMDENALLKQVIEHKVDLSDVFDQQSVTKMVGLVFGSAAKFPEIYSSKSISLNDVLNSPTVSMALTLLPALLPSVSSDVWDMAKEAINTGVIDWAKDFIGKYMTDSLFTSLGGLVSEVLTSFATDSAKDGATYAFYDNKTYLLSDGKGIFVADGLAITDNMWTHVLPDISDYGNKTFKGSAVSQAQNPATFADGRLPSLLTSTFGDQPDTTQNFKWYTHHSVDGKLSYREVGATDWIDAAVSTVIKPVEVPLIDLGLFATKTASTYKNSEGVEVEYTLENRENAQTASVKFAAVHSVSLTSLKANTKYEYRVYGVYGQNEFCLQDSLEGKSNSVYTFQTALSLGDENEFTLLAFTDLQGTISSSYQKALAAINAAKGVNEYDFIVNCGDMVDSGSNVKQWSYAQNGLSSIFGNTQTVISAGNHDKSENALTSYYNFGGVNETQNTSNGAYYSFNYGRTHFVVLNTNDIVFGGDEDVSLSGLGATQLSWLKADLDARDLTKIDYTVAVMHKGLYSIGSHTSDNDVLALQKQLAPIFYDKGVNLVLQGHDHTFSVTLPLDGSGNPIDKANNNKSGFTIKKGSKGVVYMTVGTIADKFYEYQQNDDLTDKLNKKQTIYSQLSDPTFAFVTFNSKGITVDTYAYADVNQDGVATAVSLTSYKSFLNGKDYTAAAIAVWCINLGLAIGIVAVIINKRKKAA